MKYVQVSIELDECILAVQSLNPEDVFSKRDLEMWAEDNGYIKE